MRVTEFSVRRGVTTGMLYALIALLGVVSIYKTPLEFMPKMDMPFVEIHVPYEGASPVEICEKIAEPIEEAVATLPGIKKLRSRCSSGYAYIAIELAGDVKMDYAVLDIQDRMDQIKKDLPEDIQNIMVFKFDTEQFPIIYGALTFAEDKPENNELLDRYLVRPLKTVEGVAEVRVDGLEERRVLVEIDENKLTAYGINVIQVFEALTSANLTLSAGSVEHAGTRHSIRIVGEFQDLEEIRALPVTQNVTVGDVAHVSIDYVVPFFIGRLDQRRAFFVAVLKESSANTVDASRAARAKIDEILADPRMKDMKFRVWFDQAQEITTSLDVLIDSGISGALLAILILYVFLKSLHSTAIISTSIPMSVLATTAVMYLINISFNMITLSALIVGVGMLVDNAIVVQEAIDLARKRGMPPVKAALHGAQEVGLAIAVSTTTTIIVFLPLVFTEQSQTSVIMKQLGIVLSLSILSSLVVSLTLIPLMSTRIPAGKESALPRWYLELSTWFLALLEKSLNHRGIAIGSLFGVFFLCLLILAWPFPFDLIFKEAKLSPLIEKEAVPSALMRIVRIGVDFEVKPSLPEIDAKMKELEAICMAKKEEWDVDTVAAIVSPQFVRLLLVLPVDRDPKYPVAELEDIVKEYMKQNVRWPGITIDVGAEGHGGGPPGMAGSTSIKVRGPDPGQVYQFAELIRSQLLGMDGLKEIKSLEHSNQRELHVVVDRDQARQYGFELSQVAMAVSYSIRGVPVGQFLAADTPTNIHIQVEGADEKSLGEFESMMIQNLRGEYVPLKNIARFQQVPIPDRVARDNRLITVRIPIVPKGKDLGDVKKRISLKLQNLHLPTGYSWVMGEEFQEAADDLMTLFKAIILAMILVCLIMTAQFENFFLPFVIMFELPFALIGVVLGLLIFRTTFNVLSGAGCLLLVGIIVNNAIVLVDHIHNLRKQGLSDRDSLVQGARDRLRPIMMTALTTIMGLFPMALGFNDTGRFMYSPLAVSVLGGLVVGTFLTPFIIPVVYSVADDLLAWVKNVLFSLVKSS